MGINTTVIPRSVNVDNVTIGTNATGEIELKDGGVINPKIPNDEGLDITRKKIYSNSGSTFLFGSSNTVVQNITSYTLAKTLTATEARSQVKIGVIVDADGYSSNGIGVKILKNSTQIAIKEEATASFNDYLLSVVDDLEAGDVLEVYVKGSLDNGNRPFSTKQFGIFGIFALKTDVNEFSSPF